ncbi:porin family protein [Fulvivirga ligni]|uniref:porin family protein n=1 Tax=Fulvivirga ligni TaxID=2904246 RepID=UPI001F1CFE06|nr:porin family protein [Fulvivirga ligni]UII19532.1 PorT family protein [Fulvivirga ligni]
MKKIFLAFALIAAGASVSMAQTKFGIQGGANLATWNLSDDYDTEDDLKYKLAPRIGVFLDAQLSESISLRPAIFYSSKGAALDIEDAGDGDYSRAKINYIEIPINGVFKFGKFELFAGPYVGIAISGKYKEEIDGQSEEGDFKFKNKVDLEDLSEDETYFKRTDFGIQAGVGYNFGFVSVNASLLKGLSNINPDIDMEGFDIEDFDYKITNTVINISVAYTF